MTEHRLFEAGTVPEWTTADWYRTRERAPHLEQPVHRQRLELAAEMVREVVHPFPTQIAPALPYVVDLGAGDGGLLALLAEGGYRGWGYDLQATNVAGAMERGVDVTYLDVVGQTHFVRWAPIAVCTEMLEHLVDPHDFVARIQSRYLVASSPVNETAGSHYAFHLWAWDLDGYRALLEQGGWTIEDQQITRDGLFQVIRGRR
jgi:SAM-dependent methyltransferase